MLPASADYWGAITHQLVAEHRAQEVERLGVTDQLTGVKNRSYFDQRFIEEWKRSEREQSENSILMVGFLTNSKCSTTLTGTPLVIKHCVPNTGADAAALIRERIRLAVEAAIYQAETDIVRVTCSLGGAATTIPNRSAQHEDLLKRAEMALYESKANGRNQYTSAYFEGSSDGLSSSQMVSRQQSL